MRRGGVRMGEATDQLWVDGCFYVGLDLPQVPGLLFEILFNGICLEINNVWDG